MATHKQNPWAHIKPGQNNQKHLNLFLAGNVPSRMYARLDSFTKGYDTANIFTTSDSPLKRLCASYAHKYNLKYSEIDPSEFDSISGWMQFTADEGDNKSVLLCGGDYLNEMSIAKKLGEEDNIEYIAVPENVSLKEYLKKNESTKTTPVPAPKKENNTGTIRTNSPGTKTQETATAPAMPTSNLERKIRLDIAKDIIDNVYGDLCRDQNASREDVQQLHDILMQLAAFNAYIQ